MQGLEHMARSLRRNRSKLGGTRKIEYVIACFYSFAYLPMHLFFSVVMNIFLNRVRHVWGSSHFADYVEQEYLTRGSGEDDDVIHAWHHGAWMTQRRSSGLSKGAWNSPDANLGVLEHKIQG